MLLEIGTLLGGLGFGYVASEFKTRKIIRLIKHASKKGKDIVFLATRDAMYVRIIEKAVKNLAITNAREVVILTPNSMKYCPELGIKIGFGDLYKSITTPRELLTTIRELKLNGWKESEIAKFFEEVEREDDAALKETYKLWKKWRGILILNRKGEIEVRKDNVAAKKYDVFIALDSVVKDFLRTGLNRVTIHDMVRELVFQRELEKIGQRDWLKIALAFFIALVAIGIVVKWIFGGGGVSAAIAQHIAGGASRIAPGG